MTMKQAKACGPLSGLSIRIIIIINEVNSMIRHINDFLGFCTCLDRIFVSFDELL